MENAVTERVDMPLRAAPPLAEGEVHVWHARLRNLPIMEAEPSPADDGNQMIARRDRVRQLRMGQKFVFRLLLGAYLEIPGRDVVAVRGPAGKPLLAPPLARSGITFNLSHAGDRLAIALARNMPVGIDIERANRQVRWNKLARRWFSRDEAEWLETLAADAARAEFLRLWTVREAVIKAMGATIAGHVTQVQPRPGAPGCIDALPAGWPDAESWVLHELDRETGLQGWLAVPGPVAAIRNFELGMP